MALVAEQAAFLLDVCQLVRFATARGFVVTGGELQRPLEMQEIYVRTGRSKTMIGYHLRKLAIDLNFFIAGELCYDKQQLQPVGEYWEALNPKNSWGGNWQSFKDLPHFERRT